MRKEKGNITAENREIKKKLSPLTTKPVKLEKSR